MPSNHTTDKATANWKKRITYSSILFRLGIAVLAVTVASTLYHDVTGQSGFAWYPAGYSVESANNAYYLRRNKSEDYQEIHEEKYHRLKNSLETDTMRKRTFMLEALGYFTSALSIVTSFKVDPRYC